MQALRHMSVSGLFYPGSCTKITDMIRTFDQKANRNTDPEKIRTLTPRAIIVPHAGYVYSGYTANIAYRSIAHLDLKRFIVIGPSHKHYFEGISGSFYEAFQTPCGNLPIDSAYLFALSKRFNIAFVPPAHAKEHSTEVQMPFIQHYFPGHPVIELVYSAISVKRLANIMVALLQNPDNMLVVSSDLSHFHPLQEANRIDHHCTEGIRKLDLAQLKQCEACGNTSLQAVTVAARYLKLHSKVLHYTTSAAYSHDTRSVVGYMSALFYQ